VKEECPSYLPLAIRVCDCDLRQLKSRRSRGIIVRHPISAILVFVVLTSCAESRPSGQPSTRASSSPESEESFEGNWVLSSGRSPDGEIETTETYPITLTIENGSMSGIAACNDYAGDVEISGGRFRVLNGSINEMGCRPEVNKAEARYVKSFGIAESIERTDDLLTLSGPEVELVYELVRATPAASITDVTWTLQSTIQGRGTDAPVSRARPVKMVFNRDGTFAADTGCRKVTGEWYKDGDRILFTSTMSSEERCTDEAYADHELILGIADSFTFEIDHRQMTVYGRHSDTGLVFRAERSGP
jgi:heat shock protein HslJ